MRGAFLGIWLGLSGLIGCEAELDAAAPTAGLHRGLVRSERVALQVADADLGPLARAAVERWRQMGWDAVLEEDAASDTGAARVLVGGADDARLAELAGRAGAVLDERGLVLAERSFDAETALLVATFEDPERPGRPLTLAWSGGESALAFALGRLVPGWRPMAQVWLGGELELEIDLDASGRPIAASLREPTSGFEERRRFYGRAQDGDSQVFARVAPGVPAERVAEALAEIGAARVRASEWAAIVARPPLRAVVTAHVDGRTPPGPAVELARGDPITREVSTLVAVGLATDGGRAAAEASLHAALGPPVVAWLADAVAVDAAGTWWGRELGEWCAWLELAGRGLVAAELVDPSAAARRSPHELAPQRALFFRFLRESGRLSPERLRALWTGGERFELDAALAAEHGTWLAASHAEHRAAALARRNARDTNGSGRLARPFCGAAVVATLDPSRPGYGSRAAEEALDALDRLGASGVSFTSYLALDPGPGFGEPFPMPRPFGVLEGDAALAVTLASARARGLATLLNVELLASPSGTWLGDLKRTSAAEWERFFADAERGLVHYALQAELCGVDVLSLGTGLSEATRTRATETGTRDAEDPVRLVKSHGWERLIQRTRACFGGSLTFFAEGDRAAERIDFWPRLDLVGMRLRPDLVDPRTGARPDDRRARELLVGLLTGARTFAESVDRPLVIDIGFPSARDAWRGELATGPLDLAEQDRLLSQLDATLESLRAVGATPPFGVLVSSWNLDPAAGGPTDAGYALRSKPAERTLAGLIRRATSK